MPQTCVRISLVWDLLAICRKSESVASRAFWWSEATRRAIARAAYANPSLALLDDCLSALDPKTAWRVFDALFQAKCGLLRQSGTVLVTHALHFLPQVDLILLLGQGSPAFLGTFQELRELEAKSDSTEASMVQLIQDGSQEKVAHLHHNGVTERDGVIMTVEEREYGKAGRDVTFGSNGAKTPAVGRFSFPKRFFSAWIVVFTSQATGG